MKSTGHIALALVISAATLVVSYFAVYALDRVVPALAYAFGIFTIPVSAALGVSYLLTRRPAASGAQVTVFLLMSLPLWAAMMFVVAVTRYGVEF